MNSNDTSEFSRETYSREESAPTPVEPSAEWKEAEEDLRRLLALDRDLASGTLHSNTVSESVRRFVDALVHHLGAALARIWILNERDGVLELRASAGLYTHIDGEHGRIRIGELKIGMIAQERRPHLTNAVAGDPRIPNQEWAKREGLVSFAGYPLIAQDRLLGVVAVFARRPLSEVILHAMGSVALRIAYTIDHLYAEEMLRRSELKYRCLHESMMDAFASSDLAGYINECNPAFEAMLGYTAEELRNMTYQDLTPARWHERERRIVSEQVLACGHSEVYEKEYRRRDGNVFPVEVRTFLLSDGNGQAVGMWTIVRDITERKRATQQLMRQNEFIRAALDNIYDGLVACDADGNLALFNRMAREWHGMDALKLPSDEWSSQYDLFGPDGITPLATESIPLARAFRGEHIRDIGITIAAKDQPLRHVLVSGGPFYGDDGRKLGAVIAMHDITERKRAEEAARRSEDVYRAIGESIDYGVWVCTADGRNTYVSESFLKLVGLTQEQCSDFGWADRLHPDDGDATIAAWKECVRTKRYWDRELRFRGVDGEWHSVLARGVPVLDSDGRTICWAGINLDISELKRVHERLQASEARLIDAQRLAKVGSFERHPETNKLQWSEQVLRIWGLSQVPPNLEALVSYIHPKDRESFLQIYQSAPSSTVPVDLEYRIVRPDGEVRFVRSILEAVRNDQGALVRIVGAAQDITEQVKARELLRESESRLKHAERIAHVGNWQFDVKSSLLSWSEETFDIFGKQSDYTPSYEGFLDAIVPEDRERMNTAISHCLEVKQGFSIEYRVSKPNGEVRTVGSTSEVLLDDDGSPVRLFGTNQDITESKRAQEEAVERQKLETVGTLANGMAHDFNNLLGGILAHAELARVQLAGGSQSETEIKAICESAVRGSEIVRQLMIYAGTENEPLHSVDLSQIVEEMVDLLKFSVSKHATLITNLGKDLPTVQASAGQLRQIVMNLVTNASEAIGDRDGVIRVTTECVTVGHDQTRFTSEDVADGKYLKLEVSDTGCGMSPATQGKIFDPFYTTKSAGHGLGLAVVQGTVRSLHGTIRVESQPSEGTTFEILLPSTREPAAASPIPPEAESARSRQEITVLIVEDEDSLRKPISKLMRKAGFSVLEAGDGAVAVEVIRAHNSRIDVLLLDITLPRTPSGEVFRVATRLRPDMSVIVTSAYSQDLAEEKLGGNVHHFVRKPYRLQDLLQVVRQSVL